MKKILIILSFIFLLTGCNKQLIDTNWSFDRAIIVLGNGEVIEGEVQTWNEFDNSDMIQVKINGVTYLTHSSNVVLIDD